MALVELVLAMSRDAKEIVALLTALDQDFHLVGFRRTDIVDYE
jgi:hypothetical protein